MAKASAIRVSPRIAGTKLLHLSHRTKKKKPALLKGTEERVKINPVMETVWVLDQATPGLPMD